MRAYKFILNDYRAINHVDVDLNGITVIAGENGCGKSTTTRWVYYLVDTISHFDKYAFEEYKDSITQLLSKIDTIRREVMTPDNYEMIPSTIKLRNRLNTLQDNSPDSIAGFTLLYEELVSKLADMLVDYFASPKNTIRKQRLLSFLELGTNSDFSRESFIGNYMSKAQTCYTDYIDVCNRRYNLKMWSIIHHQFDEKLELPKNIHFIEDGVEIIGRKEFVHMLGLTQCIYVDTPMALTRMEDTSNVFWNKLRMMMFEKKSSTLSAKTKKMVLRIRHIINGSVIVDPNSLDDDELRYIRDGGDLNIPIEETATGLKSFAYIMRLLENGWLDGETLLVIDEPEVHLHPQWIVEFARVLVLLNTELGVRILVASHNPDMVSALRYISEKEGSLESTTFYLAKSVPNNKFVYDYVNLGQDIGPIFESFNIALSRIELYGASSTGL